MTQRIAANDVFKITSRKVTDEGFIVAPASNIARTGIQTYRAYELGLDSDSPMKIIRLYRPPEEVFAPDSMASFEAKPLTIDHPTVNVTSANWRELAVGDGRNIMPNPDGVHLAGDITVRSHDAVAAMEAGKMELSNGYTFDLDMTPGTAPDGQAYDGVQRKIRGNHIALVDAARCGSACRISDSQPSSKQEIKIMPTQKVIVDGIPLEVGDTEAAVISQLVAARDRLTASLTGMVTLDAHTAAIKAKDAEIDTLRKDVMTPAARDAMVADWASTLNSAKKLVPEIVTDGKTCLAVRREVLTTLGAADGANKTLIGAILAGKSAADASEEMVRAAFNAVASSAPSKPRKSGQDGELAFALSGLDAFGKTDDPDKDDDDEDEAEANDSRRGRGQDRAPALTGRDAMIANSNKVWEAGRKRA